MKKIIQFVTIIITVAILATFAGCKSASDNTTNENVPAETTVVDVTNTTEPETEKTFVDELVDDYRADYWNGSRVVHDGRAYFLNEKTGCILETSPEDHSGGGMFVACPDLPDWYAIGNTVALPKGGVVAYNSDVTGLTWGQKGEIISHFDFENYRKGIICDVQNGRMEFFAYGESSVVIRQGNYLLVVHPSDKDDEWQDYFRDDVVDVIADGDRLLVATMNHENLALDENNVEMALKTSYVSFPKRERDRDAEVSVNGEIFNTGLSGSYYYLEDNGNGRNYTLYYKDVVEDKLSRLATNVVDAQGNGANCYFVDAQGNVHVALLDKVVEEGVVKGRAICLTTCAGEGDPVYAVVADGTPEATSIDGWKNVLAF